MGSVFRMIHEMRIGLGIVIVCLIVAVVGASTIPDAQVKVEHEDTEVKPQIKLFDFEHFKQLFDKQYLSLAEELARARIFLANAFQVFLRWIQFNNRQTFSYLSINEMSD